MRTGGIGKKKRNAPNQHRCDSLFSLLVRREGKCRRCHKTDGLQCAHIVSRSYGATRYDRANAMALCVGCHKYFTEHPLEWDVFVTRQIGAENYAALKQKALAGLVLRRNWRALWAELKIELDQP